MSKPEINFSLFVDKDLKYELWKTNKKNSVEIDEVPLPSELNSIKILKKLLSYLTQISSNDEHSTTPKRC